MPPLAMTRMVMRVIVDMPMRVVVRMAAAYMIVCGVCMCTLSLVNIATVAMRAYAEFGNVWMTIARAMQSP